jgi:hypothetical protein
MGQQGERRKKKKRGRKERWAELGYAGRARLWAEEKKKRASWAGKDRRPDWVLRREKGIGRGSLRVILGLRTFVFLLTTQQQAKPMQGHECIKHFGEF